MLHYVLSSFVGWGNTGAGATLLMMPLLYEGFTTVLPPHLAWRAAFFVPGVLQLIVGIGVLLGSDDAPSGNFPLLGRLVVFGAPCALQSDCCHDVVVQSAAEEKAYASLRLQAPHTCCVLQAVEFTSLSSDGLLLCFVFADLSCLPRRHSQLFPFCCAA